MTDSSLITRKRVLYIKLLKYALIRCRQFIFQYFDECTSVDYTAKLKGNENHSMIAFMLRTLNHKFEEDSLLSEIYQRIVVESEEIETSVDMFNFAKNLIPEHLSELDWMLSQFQ